VTPQSRVTLRCRPWVALACALCLSVGERRMPRQSNAHLPQTKSRRRLLLPAGGGATKQPQRRLPPQELQARRGKNSLNRRARDKKQCRRQLLAEARACTLVDSPPHGTSARQSWCHPRPQRFQARSRTRRAQLKRSLRVEFSTCLAHRTSRKSKTVRAVDRAAMRANRAMPGSEHPPRHHRRPARIPSFLLRTAHAHQTPLPLLARDMSTPRQRGLRHLRPANQTGRRERKRCQCGSPPAGPITCGSDPSHRQTSPRQKLRICTVRCRACRRVITGRSRKQQCAIQRKAGYVSAA
jgi:hypothetical protein